MKTISVHLLCELTGCDRQKLNDVAFVKATLSAAAVAAQTTILNGYFHQFEPTGVSGVLCLAESHISVHTWPEAGYAAADIFTCGDRAVPQAAVDYMAKAFGAQHIHVVNMLRGLPDDGGKYTSLRTEKPYEQGHLPVLLSQPPRAESSRCRKRKASQPAS